MYLLGNLAKLDVKVKHKKSFDSCCFIVLEVAQILSSSLFYLPVLGFWAIFFAFFPNQQRMHFFHNLCNVNGTNAPAFLFLIVFFSGPLLARLLEKGCSKRKATVLCDMPFRSAFSLKSSRV